MTVRLSGICLLLLVTACQHHAPAPPPVPPLPVLAVYSATTRADARRIAELALATTADAKVTPIPLDIDPASPRHGALYTPYLLSVLAVRDARAHGRPVESRPLGGGVADLKPVYVAAGYPLACGRTTSPAVDIRLVSVVASTSPSRREAPRLQPAARDAAGIARLLPGEVLPRGSIVGTFRAPAGDTSVEIDYGAPLCPGVPTTLIFPITRDRSTLPPPDAVVVKLPPDWSNQPPTRVTVMGVVDANGRVAFPGLASGPIALAALAEDAVRPTRGQPDHQNGLALPALLMRTVIFTATGERPAPAAGGPLSMSPEQIAELQTARAEWSANIALEMARRGPPTPIPFDAPGEQRHAFGFDNTMLAQITVRKILAERPGVESRDLPRNLGNSGTFIVAVPLVCSGRQVLPTGLQAAFAQTAARKPTRQLSAAEINTEFPDVRAPDGAIGGFFNVPVERATVTITYAEPACPLGTTTVTLATPKYTPARPAGGSILQRFPDGVEGLPSPTTVQVEAVIDERGEVHAPKVLSYARADLVLAAEQAVEASKWEPRSINGVAVAASTAAVVQFTGTGQRLSISPYALEGSTIAEGGLSRATSRCAVAADAAYGGAAQPIAVGGDDWRGVAHERAYLGALRGPAGQGVGYRIVGAEFLPASKTFVDVYELTYDGIPAPVRVYLDEYHSGPVRAPAGFTCAVPLEGLGAPSARPRPAGWPWVPAARPIY